MSTSSIPSITLSPSKLPSPKTAASPFKISRKRLAGSLEPKKLNFNSTQVKKQKTDSTPVNTSSQFEICKEAETMHYLDSLPSPLKEQALFIENKMSQIISNSLLEDPSLQKDDLHLWELRVRTKILHIIGHTQFSDEKKLAELGLLYWALANYRLIFAGNSLLEARQAQIQEEVRELKYDHKGSCENDIAKSHLLPSGAPAYVVRTFVRMIFTSDGAFNLGGCYAVKALLNGPLSLLISEEQRTQILNTLNLLIYKESFRNLLLEPMEIHPDFKRIILIDTQRDPDSSKLDYVSVRWDLLTLFFTVVAQPDDRHHCFAVSVVANLLNLGYEPLLKLLREVIKTGTFEFEGRFFPILFLLKERILYVEDFQSQFEQPSADQLIGMSIAEEALNPPSPATRTSFASLEQHVQERFGAKKGIAQALMLSLKQNLIAQSLIAGLQFVALNSGQTLIDGETKVMSHRFFLLSDIEEKFFKKIASQFPETPFLDESCRNFVDQCLYMLEDMLYFIDRRSSKKEVVGDKVVFDAHPQGLLFNGNLESYHPFMQTRRLFVRDARGTVFFINKISAFVKLLSDVIEQNKNVDDSPICKEYQNLLKTFLENEGMSTTASMIKEMNHDQTSFESTIYEQSDAFFVIEVGGSTNFILDWEGLQTPLPDSKVVAASDEKEWFEKLCTTLAAHGEFPNRQDPFLLAISSVHAFNLTPLRSEKYWNKPDIRSAITDPASHKLTLYLTEQQKANALWYILFEQHELRAEALAHFAGKKMVYAQFIEECVKILPEELTQNLVYAVNRVLEEISYATLMNDLMPILKSLNIPESAFDELIKIVKNKVKEHGELSPFEAARLVHKALLSCKEPYFMPVHKCEETIRTHYHLPAVIELGNLNWSGLLTEKLDYFYLILKYDYATQNLMFCMRSKEEESPIAPQLRSSLLASTELWFENAKIN